MPGSRGPKSRTPSPSKGGFGTSRRREFLRDPLRLLLDGNFPKPVVDVHALDNHVRYEHLADWRPELVRVSTPDWLIHLAAHADGFDGIVTSDYHQLDQDEEAIALDRTRLSVITWTRGIDNAVVLWGSILSYMPHIRRALAEQGPAIVRLPVPRLGSDHIESTGGISQRRAVKLRTSTQELRSKVLPEMVEELNERGMRELVKLLQGPRPTRPPSP